MFHSKSIFKIICVLILPGFLSCSNTKTLTKTSEILMLIDGNRYTCEESGSGYCNRISYSSDIQNAKWEFWDGKISGIDIKHSNIYQVKVIKTEQIDKNTKETKSVAFQLVELLKKEPYSREGRKNYSFLRKLRENGVKFYIRGNEPGWMIDIYNDGRIQFSTMSDRKLNFESNISDVKIEERARMKTYTFQEPKASLILLGEKCEDNMSGEKFTHQVTFNIAGKTFQGCGMAVPDLMLNDIFVFQRLIDTEGEIMKMTFEKMPYIEFNIDQMKIFGFGGCNDFGGNFEFIEDEIKIGPLMASRKACPGISEEKIMELLSTKQLNYEINGNVLTLGSEGETRMLWEKVDQ